MKCSTKCLAIDEAGNRSSSTEEVVFVDSLAPDVSLTVSECRDSLSADGCLVAPRDASGQATTTLHFSWSSSADDLDYFVLNQNGTARTTTATSTVVVADDNVAYVFGVSVHDKNGNNSATSTQEVEIVTTPVVISEIAWMGTATSSADEWIELYNRSKKDIDLTNWVLYAEDGVPYIELQNSVPARGYYLIERSDDNTISDILADLRTPFSGIGTGSGLENRGEHLFLARIKNGATTTIDEVADCGRWCGGSNRSKRTMERYDPDASGAGGTNWGTALGEFFLNGKDAGGALIRGTPKAKNSISYQIANGSVLTTDKTLTKSNSPYLITRDGFTIQPDTTLEIDPGVVIKFVSANEPALVIDGTIRANGSIDEPIVFTAFTDDEYGGDMNGDGTCDPDNASSTAACPQPGSWKQIMINPLSQNSLFKNTIIRYGGRWFNNMTMRSAVAVDSTDVEFQNTTIENSKKHGLYLKSSASEITDSTFQNNNTDQDASGIYVGGGSPRISGNTFDNNKYGLHVSDSRELAASSNIFTNNSVEAVRVGGIVGPFSGNAGSGNGLNAVVVSNMSSIPWNGTTTLLINQLPYLVRNNFNIASGTTLTFEDGVVIKGHDSRSNKTGRIIVRNNGKMFYDGSVADGVVFTLMRDDSVGGVVETATTTPSAGDWHGIVVEDGGVFDMSGFTLRYAGGPLTQAGDSRGGIRILGPSIDSGQTAATSTIHNALIEKNYQSGIQLFGNAILVLKDSLLRNHTEKKTGKAAALDVRDSTAILENVSFSGNEIDIMLVGYSTVTCDSCSSLITEPIDLF